MFWLDPADYGSAYMSEDGDSALRATSTTGGSSGAGAAPNEEERRWSGAAAGFRYCESLGFIKDPKHPRWKAEVERESQDGSNEGEGDDGDKAEGEPVDDPENAGNLGPYRRGYEDREEVPFVEGSPFTTPTVPLQLRRAVFVNDMTILRMLVNRWTSAQTDGSEKDTIAGKFATALWDESTGDTVLHIAVRKRYPEMARYLVSQVRAQQYACG